MVESTRHPSEPDDNPKIEFRKARIKVTNLDGTPLIDPEGNPIDEFLFIDWLKGGRCRIIGQYNITQEQRINPDETTTQMYVFDEGSLVWTPPPFYIVNGETIVLDVNSRTDVEVWLQSIAFEVMGYIKLKITSW